MNISVEESTALPTRLRPTPDQVCNWYEHSLRAVGADVRRVTPERLEFTLPFSQAFLDTNLRTTLAPIAEGEVEVSATSDGFEVSVCAKPRAWVSYLPVVVFAAATGGMAFLATPVRFWPAVAAVGLLGVTWLRARLALSRFLTATNEAVADSFASVPPAPHALSETPHDQALKQTGAANLAPEVVALSIVEREPRRASTLPGRLDASSGLGTTALAEIADRNAA